MCFHSLLTSEAACNALRVAGFECASDTLRIEKRDTRWAVHLPGWRLAWFAASEPGLHQLEVERRVLRLLDARCSFLAPRVLFESSDKAFDVRALVPGETDPFRLYEAVRRIPELATRIGAAIGNVLVEQHTRILASDVARWLPTHSSWPLARDQIFDRLPEVIDDAQLIAKITVVMEAYACTNVADADRLLVHGDLGVHNIAYDLAAERVQGIFDYGEAHWHDRHLELRYLVFDYDDHSARDTRSGQVVEGWSAPPA